MPTILPWNKEKVLNVSFDVEPDVRPRFREEKDKDVKVISKTGKEMSLWDEKKKYPFKVDNDIIVTVTTNKRAFSFKIQGGYAWNGADIPTPVTLFVGAKTDVSFLIPSLVHDYSIEYLTEILIISLDNKISVSEYRRLTSLILRQLFKDYGAGTIKANTMTGFVQFWQCTFASGQWKV